MAERGPQDGARRNAILLLQREREMFSMRAARQRSDAWLRGVHRLGDGGLGAKPMVEWTRLHVQDLAFQLAAAYQIDGATLRLVAGECPRSLPASVALGPSELEALTATRHGLWRGEASLAVLASALGLHSFVWEILDEGSDRVLLVAGFESAEAECDPQLGEEDLSYFRLLVDHLSVLLRNKRLLQSYAETNDRLEASLRALRDAQAKLVVADRMSSLGTLAAGVAHEINNPLTYVVANLELIAEAFAGPEEQPLAARSELREMIEDARSGADRVRKIVAGLRAFSRTDEEHRADVGIHRVLKSALDLTMNEIRHRAHLTVELGQVPVVHADEARLGQVFINLLVNAAQAIPEGHVGDNQIRVVTRTTAAGAAMIEVHDTGCGIPAAIRDRIFAPFFTTKPVGVGTGLGLSICQGIIASLSGELTVESEPNKGTVFRVLLPPAHPAAEAPAAPPEAPAAAATGRARILIVDDEVTLARALQRTLAAHDVTVVHSGREALDILSSPAHFDLILCDVMMPVMTAVELYAALPAARRERVVFMTGGAFTPAARELLEHAPNECLDKPIDPAALRATVERFRR